VVVIVIVIVIVIVVVVVVVFDVGVSWRAAASGGEAEEAVRKRWTERTLD